jgi:hypothetical protein
LKKEAKPEKETVEKYKAIAEAFRIKPKPLVLMEKRKLREGWEWRSNLQKSSS